MNELSKTLVETKLTFFVKIVHADGGIENGEISMNLNDQCRVCNCSFKVKFVFLIRLKESDLKGEVLTQNLQKVGFELEKVTSI